MKKGFIALLVLCLLAAAPALAEDDLSGRPIADGVVAAVNFTDITAPYSGTLASFDLASGDAVSVGDALFQYVTNCVYATEDGVVKSVFVSPGDDAASAMARYGAVIAIETASEYQVEATTAGAASDNDNKILHLGETLYFKTTHGTRQEGSGRVVWRSGKEYRVDLTTGDLDINAAVNLYREDDYTGDSCVGRGVVTRRDPLLIAGIGRVSALYVKEGDTVKSGDPLAAFVSADATPQAFGDTVKSPVTGVVHAVAVAAGQQVWKGELLCRVDLTTGNLDINAAVNLYREDDYTGDSCVGRGVVTRRDPLLIAGNGRVSALYVKEGDTVKSGDPLAAFVSADAAPQAFGDTVDSPVNGVVHAVAVAAGQQVWKGELLCRVDRTDELEAIADVDEVDLNGLKVGDTVPVTLDTDETNVLNCVVTQISQLGETRQNAAYFSVHASLPAGSGLLGASVSMYLPVK